jgi:hypothetical protein
LKDKYLKYFPSRIKAPMLTNIRIVSITQAVGLFIRGRPLIIGNYFKTMIDRSRLMWKDKQTARL